MTVRYQYKDTILIDANRSGERLIALVRLAIYSLIGIIPFALYFIFDDERSEVMISLVIAIFAIFFSALVYWLSNNNLKTNFISWMTTIIDISVVTLALLLVAVYGNPVVATNSLVIWQIYTVMLFTTSLRLNLPMTLFAGILAVLQYTSLVIFLEAYYDLVALEVRSEEYGMFSWSIQFGRIAILILLTVVAVGFVSRIQKLMIFSGTDSLTGLKNRAFFEHKISTLVADSIKRQAPLSVAFLDFDHFKSINDKHGHAVGDSALQRVADVLQKHSPKPFEVARWGGEEFALIYPGQTKEEATNRVNQIRSDLAQGVEISPKLKLKLKLSAGIAECPIEKVESAKLINLADDRMLTAKRLGRDRVIYKD